MLRPGFLVEPGSVDSEQAVGISEPQITVLIHHRVHQCENGGGYTVGIGQRAQYAVFVDVAQSVACAEPHMVVVVLDYESRAGSIAFGIYRDGLPFGQFHVGPCDCSPVGHKPQIVIAVLVDLSYFVMVYESVGETVVAYLAAVVDALSLIHI